VSLRARRDGGRGARRTCPAIPQELPPGGRPGYRVSVDTHHIGIAVRPLSQWPDERVSLVYGLLSAEVRALLASSDAHPVELAYARRDAELFGVEALRRGLID
jgi:hypothetical protein